MTLPSFGMQYLYGTHSGPEAPAFCRRCGRPMRIVETRPTYDRETGLRDLTFALEARCTRPWWQNILDVHDKWVGPDEHGDWAGSL